MVGSAEQQNHQSIDAKHSFIYRYPGFRSFQDSDIDRKLFFGRKEEQNLFLHKVLSQRLMVLYAKSGMGKTSLLNAGIFERLRSRQYIPLVVRLHESEKDLWNTFFDGITDEAEKNKATGYLSDWKEGNKNTLWEYFKTAEFWNQDIELLTPVLVLDQFEELFTLISDDGARKQFIKQLSDLVRGRMPLMVRDQMVSNENSKNGSHIYSDTPPDVKTIVSIRETHYGQLQSLAKKIPEIFDNRFRLESLTRNNARSAIIEPAIQQIGIEAFDQTGFTYSEEAIDQILNFLCSKRTEKDSIQDSVEPFQLQQLCGKIEEKAQAKVNRRIEADDLGGESGMNRILQDFYNDEMNELPEKNEQEKVQTLIEEGLISRKSKIRIPLHGEDIQQRFGVSDETLNHLIHRRLLRSERKEDGYLYELSHDTLIKPILDSRDKRLAHLKEAQKELEARKKRLKEKQIKHVKIKIQLKSIIGALFLTILPAALSFYFFYDLPKQYFSDGVMEKDPWQKIKAFNKAIDTPVNFPNAHLELAKAYLSVENSDKAVHHLEEAIKQKPNHHEAHFILANVYADKRKYDLALIYYENTTIMDSSNCLAYYALGNLQLELGKNELGFKNLGHAIDCGPQNIDYYFRKADILRSQNRFDEVVEIYQKGIENNPNESRLYLILANELFHRREYERAAIRYEQSLKKEKAYSTDTKLLQNLAFCYFRTNRYMQADQFYQKAAQLIQNDLKMNPELQRQALAQIYFSQGQVFLKREMYAEAIDYFSDAIKNYPFMVSAYEKISEAYSENKQPEMAEEYKNKEILLRSF